MDFTGVELFLDDRFVSFTDNIRRRVQTAQVHPESPLIRREHPWEQGHVCLLGSVRHDPERDLLRMWYMAVGKNYPTEKFMAYAESDDGVHWTRPMLDLVPYEGIRKTNILFGDGFAVTGPAVLPNPDQSDPERRFLVTFNSYTKTHDDTLDISDTIARWNYIAWSPDGIHWNPPQGRKAFGGKADSCQSTVWDPVARVFRAYVRRTLFDPLGQRVRTWAYLESPDFEHWGPTQELLRLDAGDGGSDGQIQQLSITRYDGIYIGLLSMFRVEQYYQGPEGGYLKWDRSGPQGDLDEGPQINDIQLVTSRDGVNFTRVGDRQIFLGATRREGVFSTSGHRTAGNLVVFRDKVHIFCDGRLGGWGQRSPMQIGLATVPVDRFVSMEPDRKYREGVIELVPLVFPDTRLRLNASTRNTVYTKETSVGCIWPEAADPDGHAIAGFSRKDAVPMDGDRFDHPLQWKRDGKTYDLSALPQRAETPVRLRFWMDNAKVFSLRTESCSAGGRNWEVTSDPGPY
ncbi:MAG: hypothetical protein CMJ18_10915 [Phycisphaeraceae bacterium]|nr:hypothetical protein [Phycisphaeraceae bacterium]